MKRRNFLKQLGVAASLPLLAKTKFSNAAEPSSTKTNSNSHTVLSCNVRVDVPADAKTGDSWAQRREMCADIIQAQHADLIGLQEAQAAHLDYLKSRMPEYDTYALSHANDYFHPIDAIFFRRDRYELISCGGFWLSETPHIAASKGWDTANPRLCNWVHLRERNSKKEFRYWNTHLDHKGQKAREHGALMICEASAVFPKELPQILTGDMNARSTNPAIKNYIDGGWLDIYSAVNGPKDPGFTAHGFRGAKNPPNGPDGKPKGRIDWIFSRGPVKPLASKIIKDSRNGHYPSDHYFVSADVAIG
jgi:endonuclease/exonuclease/phosphatase family metal-dependent hydrolase